MSDYDDLMRSLLVERFTPVPLPHSAAQPAADIVDRIGGLPEERRRRRATPRKPRRQTTSTNIIETTRRTS